jgi:hypothetical protein
MMSQSYSAIRSGMHKSLLGMTDKGNDKPYVVGFPRYDMARRICTKLPPEPAMRLVRKSPNNFTSEFNSTLSDIGLEDLAVDKLTVDYTAHLIVQKMTGQFGLQDELLEMLGGFVVADIPSSEFLLYPFEKAIGIIMPVECIKETRNEIVFQAMVIDPCFNVYLFKSGLVRPHDAET